MKNNIGKILLLIISIISIGFIQSNFNKITAWDVEKYIDFPILNAKMLIINKLFNIGNEGLYTSIVEHSLPIQIVKSIDIGKNKWLLQKSNINYIDTFMKLYGYRGNIYIDIFSNIISEKTVKKEVIDKYEKLLINNLHKEMNHQLDNGIYSKLYKKLEPILCKDIQLPINSNFNKLYNNAGYYYYKNKQFTKSGCYILTSGYNNGLDSWKTGIMNTYTQYILTNINKEEFKKNYKDYRKNLLELSVNLKQLIINTPISKIHRNTTKTASIILINRVYVNNLNKLALYYLLLKKRNEIN